MTKCDHCHQKSGCAGRKLYQVMPCLHTLHSSCIVAVDKLDKTCPVCSTTLFNKYEEKVVLACKEDQRMFDEFDNYHLKKKINVDTFFPALFRLKDEFPVEGLVRHILNARLFFVQDLKGKAEAQHHMYSWIQSIPDIHPQHTPFIHQNHVAPFKVEHVADS